MSPIDQYVIDRVRELRTKQRFSRAELAYAIGVNKSFIGAVENPNHRSKYNIKHLNDIAAVLNCKFADFFPEKPFGQSLGSILKSL